MTNGLNECIARYICYAQASSDAGKHLDNVVFHDDKFGKALRLEGYNNKTTFILRAIEEINKAHGKSGFKYSCMVQEDQNGYDSVVTYFTYRLYGERKQISFHTPLWDANCLMKYSGKRNTHWDKCPGGSRANCEELWLEVVSD